MRLFVGLGNPGVAYAKHRHNIGFLALDGIHRAHAGGAGTGFGPWRRKFEAHVSEGFLDGVRVLLMKPQTFMNESGRAVAQALRFYKIDPSAVIVFHDDLDLPPGKVRIKQGGGHGGHNGLRSIGASIGDNYGRVRIGIGHPGAKDQVIGYVLHDFAQTDATWLDPLIAAIAAEAGLLATERDQTFANRVHLALAAPERSRSRRGDGTSRFERASSQATVEGERKTRSDVPPHGALAAGLRRLFGEKDQ